MASGQSLSLRAISGGTAQSYLRPGEAFVGRESRLNRTGVKRLIWERKQAKRRRWQALKRHTPDPESHAGT